MLFYESKSMDPAWNLALEEIIFQAVPAGGSCLYLWQNSPSVIIGKNQCAENEADLAFLDRHNIPLVRRLSGGGAVYHDPGNLNYTVIVDMDALSPEDPDSFFSLPVIRALGALGVNAVRSGRNDLLLEGRKIGGCGQYERDGRLLHHGCIMLDTDLAMLGRVLRVHPAKLRSHGIASVRSRVTTIGEYARQHGRDISPDFLTSFKALLRKEFAGACSGQETKNTSASEGADPSGPPQDTVLELSAASLSAVRFLAGHKYRSPAWNIRREAPAEAPVFEEPQAAESATGMCAEPRSTESGVSLGPQTAESGVSARKGPQPVLREHKFESGLVSVRMEVLDGRIHRIRIRGDFFGSADISILERQMEGLPLDEQLADRLRTLPVGSCMQGIRAEDLAGLIL